MHAPANPHQPEARAVSRTIGHTRVSPAFDNLLFSLANHGRAVSIHFEFPADEPGFGEPLAQFGNDFGRRQQLCEQGPVPGGNFSGLHLRQVTLPRAHPDLAEFEITDGGSVEHRVHRDASSLTQTLA